MSPAPAPSEQIEGRPGVGRVEAFSDGVVAIIVTIMVLELHAPVADGIDKLWSLWPVLLAYVLSYAYVAIYWVNHHRLFSLATVVTNGLLWSNMLLLFALSFIPFTASYLGEHHFSREAMWLYLASMIFPATCYTWLQSVICRTGRQGEGADAYYRRSTHKGYASLSIYLMGIPLTWVSPWLGVGCAVVVAILWVLPETSIDLLFDGRAGGQKPR